MLGQVGQLHICIVEFIRPGQDSTSNDAACVLPIIRQLESYSGQAEPSYIDGFFSLDQGFLKPRIYMHHDNQLYGYTQFSVGSERKYLIHIHNILFDGGIQQSLHILMELFPDFRFRRN